MATHVVAAAQRTFRELHGVVVSAGLMQKTVKVRVGGRQWNAQVQKVGLCSQRDGPPGVADTDTTVDHG